ncbi:unnamed protein product [Albugo candida]|uniref:Uncharacterized protein n=1 Tax=Albugo candida TaxID=65357 RepID=A0A024FUH9_9STRA|nr:unnamed protein product [Albugo candida]|eukprot:CCI10552.1 unnamed protein product [Albugo candida]
MCYGCNRFSSILLVRRKHIFYSLFMFVKSDQVLSVSSIAGIKCICLFPGKKAFLCDCVSVERRIHPFSTHLFCWVVSRSYVGRISFNCFQNDSAWLILQNLMIFCQSTKYCVLFEIGTIECHFPSFDFIG